jgi:ABC-type branched-subunit amino acid transport system permease subunit
MRALWYGVVAAFIGYAFGLSLPFLVNRIGEAESHWSTAGFAEALHVVWNQAFPPYLLPVGTILGICTSVAAGVGGIVHGTLYEERKSKNSKGNTGVGVAAVLALLTGAVGGAVFGLGCPQIREDVRASAAMVFAVSFALFGALLAGAAVHEITLFEEQAAKAEQRHRASR